MSIETLIIDILIRDAVVIHTLDIELKIMDTLVMISLVMYAVVENVLDIDAQAAWMYRL